MLSDFSSEKGWGSGGLTPFQFTNHKDCQSTSSPQRHPRFQGSAAWSKGLRVLESPCWQFQSELLNEKLKSLHVSSNHGADFKKCLTKNREFDSWNGSSACSINSIWPRQTKIVRSRDPTKMCLFPHREMFISLRRNINRLCRVPAEYFSRRDIIQRPFAW